ncbi:hypothetical protein [Streptomyces sp. NPDC018833]|uniref:hypothetical protein n=1 Tax=Streptomyces sp. NPDC018833 TaxID=3365053 RepID=UPI0037A10B58
MDGVGLLEGHRSDLLKVILRPDEEIAAEIRHTVLLDVPTTARVEVSVKDGMVVLGCHLDDRALVPLLARLSARWRGPERSTRPDQRVTDVGSTARVRVRPTALSVAAS